MWRIGTICTLGILLYMALILLVFSDAGAQPLIEDRLSSRRGTVAVIWLSQGSEFLAEESDSRDAVRDRTPRPSKFRARLENRIAREFTRGASRVRLVQWATVRHSGTHRNRIIKEVCAALDNVRCINLTQRCKDPAKITLGEAVKCYEREVFTAFEPPRPPRKR